MKPIYSRAHHTGIRGFFVFLLLISPAGAQAQSGGICDRSEAVRDAVVANTSATTCAQVSSTELRSLYSELDLSSKSISALKPGDFAGLRYLRKLDLRGNNLRSLPPDIFDGLVRLTELNLRNNGLTSLPPGVFDGLTRLTELDLHKNDITSLPPRIFADLSELEALCLDAEDFANLPPDTFAGIPDAALPAGVPSMPRAVEVTPGNQRLIVNWRAPARKGAAYRVRWKLETAGTFARADSAAVHKDSASHIIPNLANESEYEVQVASVNTFAGGNYSSAVLGTPGITCDRSAKVRVEIRDAARKGSCSGVTAARLATISSLNLENEQLGSLKADDFAGMSGLTRLTLRNTGLSSLPAGIFDDLASLQNLQLYDNSLTALPERAFRGSPRLNELNLQNNALTALPAGVFAGLSNLSYLRLDNNALTTLPVGIFAGLSKLTSLRLENNMLTTLHAGVFAGLSKLWQLYLNDNALTTLPDGVFMDLGDSEHTGLKLGGNAFIATLPASVFAGLSRATRISIRAPPKMSFRDWRRGGGHPYRQVHPRMGGLLVSWWPLCLSDASYRLRWKPATAGTFAPEDAVFIPDADYPDCRGRGRRHSYDYTITGLTNGVEYEMQVAGSTTFAHGPYSDSVRGTPVTLPTVPRNLALEAGEGKIAATWDAPAFDGGTEITGYNVRWKAATAPDFHAYRNRFSASVTSYTITRISPHSNLPAGAAYDVQVAAVNSVGTGTYSNSARSAPGVAVCDRTTAVRDEIVRATAAASCSAVTADALGAITTLNVSSKSMRAVEAGDFGGLAALTALDLGNNSMTALPLGAFLGMPALRELRLHSNALSALSKSVFDDIPTLRVLRLDDNSLRSLQTGVFNSLSALTTLRLSGNSLSTLRANLFAGMSALSRLELGGNSLYSLSAGAFNGLSELRTLSLSGNRLSSLPAGVFKALPALSRLELENNLFGVLPPDTFMGLSGELLSSLGVPGEPRDVTLAAGNRRLAVAWLAPAGNRGGGGSRINCAGS